ncbi:MAG TPA: hypothetical protein VLU91_08490 [Nitrososphaerales archaeon]|nr:hypothetical protein [Nitrososphaerales archaeon]
MILPVSAAAFNNVQVFATASSSQDSNFQFSVYNFTGSLVASYQAPYPAAAFELPSGEYLFTATATQPSPLLGYACPVEGVAVPEGTSSSPAAVPSNQTTAPIAIPACRPPSSDYGYFVASISGSQTLNIAMQNVSMLPTTQVTIKVAYVNGTAASGASVSASVVGEWYYWWWQSASIRMSAQTDSNGVAHLVLPVAPAVVTAWSWLPVFAGKNSTTVQATVGGETINVTIYWQPTYVGLSASALLLPPQNTLNLTLHYQQPSYWVMPAGVATKETYGGGASTPATIASQPNGVPALTSASSGSQSSSQYYLPTQIPALEQPGESLPQASQTSFFSTYTAGAIVFLIAAILVVSFAAIRSRKRPLAFTR